MGGPPGTVVVVLVVVVDGAVVVGTGKVEVVVASGLVVVVVPETPLPEHEAASTASAAAHRAGRPVSRLTMHLPMGRGLASELRRTLLASKGGGPSARREPGSGLRCRGEARTPRLRWMPGVFSTPLRGVLVAAVAE
jgi:hypothetical protein